MALLFLKNSIFGQTRRLSSPRPPSEHRSSISEDTIYDGDLERQPLLSSGARTEKESGRFTVNARVIADATIGLSDGLTVPFALTAGLSALGQTRVVIFGGLAELIAGAISMGLGGYLGAKSEAASYIETRNETARLIKNSPSVVESNIRDVFEPFDLPSRTLDEITQHLSASPRLVDFLVQFQHCASEPPSSRAFISALTIAGGYLFGGLVPLIPYFCVPADDVYLGLYISIGVMAVALFCFGYMKTCIVVGWRDARCIRQGVWGGLEMVIVGGAAAGAAMGLVKLFDHLAKEEDSVFFMG